MRLSKEIFDELVLELSRTPKATEAEFKKRTTAAHEFVRVKNKTSKILATSKLIHYSLSNEKLNKIISDIILFINIDHTKLSLLFIDR